MHVIANKWICFLFEFLCTIIQLANSFLTNISIYEASEGVSFDFSMDTTTLVDFVQELEFYQQQREHVTNSLNRMMNEMALAERNREDSCLSYR